MAPQSLYETESDGGKQPLSPSIVSVRSDSEPKLPYSTARCIALIVTLAGAQFINSLSNQAVVIVLPTIGHDLNIPESRTQWVITSFVLIFGCFLLFWGRIADIYDKKIIFVGGSAWLAITTAVSPFIKNEIGFDLVRGLSALGAAASIPTALGILGTTFPPGKAKTYAFSAWGGSAPLGALLGNIMAGYITEYASWKWVFWAIAILAGLFTTAAILVLPSSISQHEYTTASSKLRAIDWTGALLITTSLLALLLALTQGNTIGWTTPWIPVLIILSLILLTLYILWQRRLESFLNTTATCNHRKPLMKISIFASFQFSAALLFMFLFSGSFAGFLVFATYFYQDYMGLSPLATTLRFIPCGITGVLTACVVARLIARVPARLLLIFGNLSVVTACLLFAMPTINPDDTPYWAWGFPAMVLAAFGADTMWPCITLFVSAALPKEDQGMGGALVNAMGQVGRAVGLAVGTAVQTAVMAHERGVSVQEVGSLEVGEWQTLHGLRAAEWWFFGLGCASSTVVCVGFRGAGVVGQRR